VLTASESWLWVQRLGVPGAEPPRRVAAGRVAVPTSCMNPPTPDLWGQEKRSEPHSTPRRSTEGSAANGSVSDSVIGLRAWADELLPGYPSHSVRSSMTYKLQ